MGGLRDVTVAMGCLKSAVAGVKKIFYKGSYKGKMG